MNIQIVSNARNIIGGENFTNEFVMPLPTLLDGENRDMYIRVLNISYPLTIQNVLQKKCGIAVRMRFPTVSNDINFDVKYETDMMYLPPGYYTLTEMVNTLNAFVDEYDITFKILNGGCVGVSYSIERNYYFSNPLITQANVNTDDHRYTSLNHAPTQHFREYDYTTANGDELEIDITPTLAYMLGLSTFVIDPSVVKYKTEQLALDNSLKDKTWYHFMNKSYNTGQNLFACTFYGAYLPDISDGIDKMFIYCDEVEMSIVGDTYARLLAIVHLKGENRGDGSLCLYTPPDIRRKLIKSKINQFKIGL